MCDVDFRWFLKKKKNYFMFLTVMPFGSVGPKVNNLYIL